MPTNEERDDLNPSLQQILQLKRDGNNTTLSTKFKNVADKVKELLKLDMQKNPIQENSLYKVSLQNPQQTNQVLNQLNNNPALIAMGQALLQKMGQTPDAQQQQNSTLPNPFKTGTPKLERGK
ncbi:MAG: hypothetical protein SFW07_08260 [Gammaproteobacteria bacterium]|nr:hypothetical protein [Gammaproteobacteria bacterium]